MHERAVEFNERASNRYGLDIDVVEFDEGTKTAGDAAEAVGCETAAIASTIVVSLTGVDGSVSGDRADGGVSDDRTNAAEGSTVPGLVAAITSGANRLNLDAVATHFRADAASMGDPDRIRQVIGWSIGGVPPICHDTAVPTTFDPTLMDYDQVYGAAGTPNTVFAIAPAELASLANATTIDLTE